MRLKSSKQKEQPMLLKISYFANVSALDWCHYQRFIECYRQQFSAYVTT